MDGSASFDNSSELSVAGWGFTAALPNGEHLVDFCGPVITSPTREFFAGAGQSTNNTAELSAIYFACQWLVALSRAYPNIATTVRFDYDSEYATNIARKIWRPASNAALALATRDAVDLVASHFQCDWNHVDAHTGELLNERADVLAKVGSRGTLLTSHRLHRRLLLLGRE